MIKTSRVKKLWLRRFTDPVIRWAWNNATKVTPIDRKKGRLIGTIHYPDGTIQQFAHEKA